MTVVSVNLLRALEEAGVDKDLAAKAAEEVASRDTDIAELKQSQKHILWVCSINLTLTLLLVGKLFILH